MTHRSVKPEDISFVAIYPPIGIARVGNSGEYFIGPEVPGTEPIPKGGFKDKDFNIKKQAVRFRLYAYGKDNKVIGELNHPDDPEKYTLKWKVHVANKKAAWVVHRSRLEEETWELRNPKVQSEWPPGEKTHEFTNTRTSLIIDPGEKEIEGANVKGVFLDGDFGGKDGIPLEKNVNLGELRTDECGRLLFLASDGDAYSVVGNERVPMLESGFNNAGWVDKVCDGTVNVIVTSKSGLNIKVKNRAMVTTAPPRFSSGTHAPTTLYEQIEDMYERPRRLKDGYDVGEVNYYRDIYPLFKRSYLISWTNNYRPPWDASVQMRDHHGPEKMKSYFENPKLYDNTNSGRLARKRVFDKIRDPVIDGDKANQDTRDNQADHTFMPALAGDLGDPKVGVRDRWASLTKLQWGRLKKWADGDFVPGKREDQNPYENVKFDDIPPEDQPSALTKSALEWAIGAALYPGIEVFWIMENEKIYEPAAQDEPWNKFRFVDTITPGDLTKGLCLPWQSDFYMCQGHWWPSVRPDTVVPDAVFMSKLNKPTPPADLATSFNEDSDRKQWDRGLQGSYHVRYERNTDMVRKWNKFGFVARERYETSSDQLEIHIERQRDPSLSEN